MKNLIAVFTRADEAKREVEGVIVAEVPDKSGEIFDYKSSAPLFQKWSENQSNVTGGKSLGNVREMHDSKAVGKLTAVNFEDDQRRISVTAKVVDDSAWMKVTEGVLTSFSIGGRYKQKWVDEEMPEYLRYTADPVEVSLVDNPAIPGTNFSMKLTRADGTEQDVMLKGGKGPNQMWCCASCKSDHCHGSKADAAKCMGHGKKEAEADTLAKCLYCVADLAVRVAGMKSLADQAGHEGMGSASALSEATASLHEVLMQMVEEAGAEPMAMSDSAVLQKLSERIAKEDRIEALTELFGRAAVQEEVTEMEKAKAPEAPAASETAPVQKLIDTDAIAKAVENGMTKALEAVNERFESLEEAVSLIGKALLGAGPAKGATRTVAVEKGEDTSASKDATERNVSKSDKEMTVRDRIAKELRSGGKPYVPGLQG